MPTSALSQRRRVIDTVSDHRHLPAFTLELGHLRRLVARQDLGDHLVNTELAGDPLGGCPVVAGEHDDLHVGVM
jgi:hypothetical protein